MQDVAIRFDISMASCSSIFTTLIKFLSGSLAQALVIWLPKDTVVSNQPSAFKDSGCHKHDASFIAQKCFLIDQSFYMLKL